MKTQNGHLEKTSLVEKVLSIYVNGFLAPGLGAGEMICIFDLVEQNLDGKTRLRRLIEEQCTIELTEQQIKEAKELLEDYPAN